MLQIVGVPHTVCALESILPIRRSLLERLLLPLHRRRAPSAAQNGLRGEDVAYFHLRGLGYTVVARRWRWHGHRGELDLVAWEGDVLCFVEVKTRSARGIVPAEFSVDREKQAMLRRTAGAYISHLPRDLDRRSLRTRFDVVSVYLDETPEQVELRRGAFH